MPAVTIKDVTLGEGRPKIVVPLTGATLRELLDEVEALAGAPADVVEWRVDHFGAADDAAAVTGTARELAAAVGPRPLLVTFRTAAEGGAREVDDASYGALCRAVADSGAADLLDVEVFRDEGVVRDVVAAARAGGVAVVMSSHDFAGTPPAAEVTARLGHMVALGADVAKIAVMPHDADDVLALLSATRQARRAHPDVPLITMAMGGLGVVTRLAGEVFGSAATFGAVGRPSAPGQVPADALAGVLDLIHHQLQVG